MKKLSFNQMESTEGGKFWGRTWDCGNCNNGVRQCTSTMYVFWFGGDVFPYQEAC